MEALDAETIALSALVMSAVLLLATVALAVRLGRLRRQMRASFPDGIDDVVEALSLQKSEIDEIRSDVATVHMNTERLGERLQGALARVGVVRYDAFGDVGGAQSFSVALLDRKGDGVVISAINGRTETRSYGKEVIGGESEHTLSDEEREAVRAALEGRRMAVVNPKRRRRTAS